MAKKGEFENRDRDESTDLSGIPLAGSFGELPEDLSDERGDLNTYALRAAENMAPDMARAQTSRVDAADTGVGSPRIDYGVRSTYDSRPINHREFNLWFEGELIAEPPAVLTFDIFRTCFFVPQGYVAIIRGITFLIEPFVGMLPYDGRFSLLVNGGIVDPMQVESGPAFVDAQPVQVPIPFRDGEQVTTFCFADEGSAVGVEMTVPDVTEYESEGFLNIGFYGQFLLKTGVPSQFQAANEAGRARTAVTSSRNDLAIQSSEGVTATRRKRVPFPNVPLLRGGK